MSEALDSILARLQGVRRNGSGWQALCPAHADKNPSLSIDVRDGKMLVHCHAGCSTEAVLAAARIEMRELFLDGATAPHVAQYSYTDERGNLLFQVLRYQPKDFKQRRPDRNGGWVGNLDRVRRVLYRLPEVRSAKSVLIVEGEKDCETARRLGLVATTNACGSRAKWLPEYSEALRGKRIAIIADADDSGRKHAQQVATSLHGKVESLKVLELPSAKDLSEWVEHGGTRDALLELIRNAPERKSTTQGTSGFTLTPLADLLARPDIPVEYIVENLLVAGTVACIVAKPKVGKSTFARNLCLSVSRGVDFLGLKTKQGECIYLALEEREEDLKNDFQAMGADGSEPIYTHAAAAPAEGIDAACDLVRQRRPVLVVIDPLFRLARIKDEKAYAETYAALGPLIDVAREVGTLVVLVHHAGKSAKADAIDSPLGSTAIGGAVNTVVLLKKQTESATRTIQTVPRIGQEMPETVLRFDLATRSLSLGARKDEADVQAAEEAILEYLKSMSEPKTEPEIDEAVEGKTGLKRKALRALATCGTVSREGCGKRGDPYKYAFSFSCSQDIAGTREQETENRGQAAENKDRISCSQPTQDSILVPASGEQQKRFEEGEL